MRSYTLTLLLAAVLSVSASAQPKPGIKAGLNYAGLSGYDGDMRLSGHAGIFLQWAAKKNWRIQPELLYSAEGQRYTVSENETTVEKTIAVSFASLPVMFQYIPSSKFYFEAGPQISFLVAAKDKGTSGKADVKRNLRNTSFSLNAGAGMLAGKRFEIYLRYSLGFTDITLYDNDKDCSRVVQAGLAFKLK